MIIKVKSNLDRFINKCLNNHINIHIIKRNNDYLLVKIKESNYLNIKKLNYYSNIEIVKYLGYKGIKIHFKKYVFDYTLLGIFFLLIFFFSKTIVKVDIRHENSVLRRKVMHILKTEGIEKYQIGKDLKTLNKISDKILKNNRDFLDWISINKDGMKYIVSFEERIINPIVKEDKYCHVIAKKDGVIRRIVSSSGVSLVERDMFVKKGDILITGEIKNNDEIKSNVCAKGKVYAEVWYKINVTYPLKYYVKEYTHKKRINFLYTNKSFYHKHYKYYDEEILFKFKNFKIVQDKEYKYNVFNYSIKEAKTNALKLVMMRIKNKLAKDSVIISKNVLKERENNSKIELEVFISVDEDISLTKTYKVGDFIDTK